MTDPATKFSYIDAPTGVRGDSAESKRDFYRRLYLWNEGRDIGGWVDWKQERRSDCVETVDALGSFLDVTDYQRARAREMLDELPQRVHQGNATRAVVFVVLVISCREDGRHYYPNEGGDRLFDELIDDLDYSRGRVTSLLHRVEKLLGDT